jgi:dihydropteroate synthase
LRFAGFELTRPLIMGVVNVTPDSFYAGSQRPDPEAAIAHAERLLEEGADILDVGGESTRPGADPVEPDTELARILPVVTTLAEKGAVVSIDTRRAAVMRSAITAGARIVNDVTALTDDPGSLKIIVESGVSVVLMHMQGEPRTMQAAPHYINAPAEIEAYLASRITACRAAGIGPERLAIDPGIGFGKTVEHNLEILASLGRLRRLGVAILVGASRKEFIGKLSGGAGAEDRLPGSLAAALAAVSRGAHIVRVHDVAATKQALAVWQAIQEHG